MRRNGRGSASLRLAAPSAGSTGRRWAARRTGGVKAQRSSGGKSFVTPHDWTIRFMAPFQHSSLLRGPPDPER